MHVLEPHAQRQRVELAHAGRDVAAEPDDVLILQGPFLLHPELHPHLDRVVHLETSDSVGLRRIAGRDARSADPETLLRVRRSALPAQRGFDQIVPPREKADLVLDGDNALGPA
jgi:hypothetical protein